MPRHVLGRWQNLSADRHPSATNDQYVLGQVEPAVLDLLGTLIGSRTAFSRATYARQPVFPPYGIASKTRRNLLTELSYPVHKLALFTFC